MITSTGRMPSLKNCLNYILGGGRGQPPCSWWHATTPLASGVWAARQKWLPQNIFGMQLGNDKISKRSEFYVCTTATCDKSLHGMKILWRSDYRKSGMRLAQTQWDTEIPIGHVSAANNYHGGFWDNSYLNEAIAMSQLSTGRPSRL